MPKKRSIETADRNTELDPHRNYWRSVGYTRRERIRRLGQELLKERLERMDLMYEDPDDDLEEKLLKYFKSKGWDDEPTWRQPNITFEEFKRRLTVKYADI